MSNVDINVDRRTDGQKIGRLYRTLLQAGAIKNDFSTSLIPHPPHPLPPSQQILESQIWPCHKKVKGQPMIIIWTNLVDLRVLDAIYHDSTSKLSWFWRRTFSRVFTIYGHGGHLVQLRRTIWTNWQYPFDRRPMANLVKIPQAVSEKNTFKKNYTISFMYIAQWQGQITLWGQNYDYN